jgi:hypothetical protein
MEVWIVESGEAYEGGSVRGVYSNAGKAHRAALGMMAVMDYSILDAEWGEVELDLLVSLSGARKWVCGCDWIKMTPRPVE